MKFAALGLAFACLALPAAAEDARARTSIEVGAVAAEARSDTVLNPGASLVDAGQHTTQAALRLQAQAAQGALRFTLDAWAEARREDGATGARLITNEAVADLTLGELTNVATGVALARWGTGYSWNPASPVQDPNANNSSRARPYRRDGDPFLRLETGFGRDAAGVYLTHFLQTDPLLSARERREWALYGRYQHVLDGGDLSGFLSFGKGERFAGAAFSATVGEQLALHGEVGLRSRRRAPQTEAIAVPTPQGPQTLVGWNDRPRHQTTPALLFGGQYTFANRSNVIVEVSYNGNGLSRAEYGRLLDAAASGRAMLGGPLDAAGRGFLLDANGLVGRLRRQYLFVRVARDEIARDLDLHYYLRAGLEDGAQVHGLLLRHNLRQGISAALGAEFYTGPPRSESRLIPVRHRIEATFTVAF